MSILTRVELANGRRIWADVSASGPTDVSLSGAVHLLDVDDLRGTVADVAQTVSDALVDAAPDQWGVEFGIELAVKAGKLVSVLAEASGKASLKITLSWTRDASGGTGLRPLGLDGDSAAGDD